MDGKLNLELGGKSVFLRDNTSINLEMNSPLWNDNGTFSYPIQVVYSANEFLFRSLAEVDNDEWIDRFTYDFTLRIDGCIFLYGTAKCTDISLEDDQISLELTSGNKDFKDVISDKSLRDLDFGERIVLGTYEKKYHFAYTPVDGKGRQESNRWWLTRIHPKINTTEIYPIQPFCNIPVLFNGEKKSLDWSRTEENRKAFLSVNRRLSSPCFFVFFILKEIFALMDGFQYSESDGNELFAIDDLRRLILINTQFKYRLKKRTADEDYLDEDDLPSQPSKPYPFPHSNNGNPFFVEFNGMSTGDVFATSENLPDLSIQSFLDGLFSAFGARLHVDYQHRNIRIYLFRNLFRRKTIPALGFTASTAKKEAESFKGFTLCYSENDGDEFKYYGSPFIPFAKYNELLNEYQSGNVLKSSVSTFVVKNTGNFYRTKVDKYTGDDPVLFEVSQFAPYEVTTADGETDGEKIEIGFSPIVPNSTENAWHSAQRGTFTQTAFFADVDVSLSQDNLNYIERVNPPRVYWDGGYDISYVAEYSRSMPDNYAHWNKPSPINYEALLDNLLSYDAGFTLGIWQIALRKTHRDEANDLFSILEKDADGLGNDSWISSTQQFAVTNDFVSPEGDIYVLPGQDTVAKEDLVSLRISSQKRKAPVPESEAPNFSPETEETSITGELKYRGLAPQFYADYIHFLTRRKTLTFTGRANVAFLSSIKWEYPYLIEGYRCFINKISFSVSPKSGIGEVKLEVYTF